jgi:hypothetical protein
LKASSKPTSSEERRPYGRTTIHSAEQTGLGFTFHGRNLSEEAFFCSKTENAAPEQTQANGADGTVPEMQAQWPIGGMAKAAQI